MIIDTFIDRLVNWFDNLMIRKPDPIKQNSSKTNPEPINNAGIIVTVIVALITVGIYVLIVN